ncbi:MAG: CDP-alcohol phosphatidyltransferase family protein [Clostridia bacterium]|nr:CDP-alcohol phosphatidyltransferase family protein [Clostridia bacterium]
MKNKDNFLRNIPNIISVVRIALVAVFAAFFTQEKYLHSLVVYALAFLSDVLDGFLARRFNWITSVGKLLDPLADKLMLITALVCFLTKGIIPPWVLLLMGSKEIMMCICGIIFYKRGVVVESDITGKVSTGLWTLTVVALLLQNAIPGLSPVSGVIMFCAVASSVFALVNYAVRYFGKKTSAE